MMLKTDKECNAIIRNITSYCKGKSKRLTKASYNFVMLSSGFIAEYNIEGFMQVWPGQQLGKAILANKPFNQWENFTPTDELYRYMMQKRYIYNSICDSLKG